MEPIATVGNPDAAASLLDPIRMRMLDLLKEPDSATGVARRMSLPRQKANYHLRELEKHGLVTFLEARRKGNCTERVMQATARHYLVDPSVFGKVPEVQDRFSSAHLIASAGRAITEVAELASRARAADKKLATLTMTNEIRFRSPQDRSEFAYEYAKAVAQLMAKYHDETCEGGRQFRMLSALYPALENANENTAAGAGDAQRAL